MTGKKGKVAKIILQKLNLPWNIVSNYVPLKAHTSDEENESMEFVSGLEVTWSVGKKT